MRKLFLGLAIVACTVSCKQTTEEDSLVIHDEISLADSKEIQAKEAMTRILDAHGALDAWQDMQTLSFEFEGGSGMEKHIVSLKNRQTKIENEHWTIGYDGSEVWLQQKTQDSFKSNARFYHNLYFYFVAMPFVLGDAGVIYEDLGQVSIADGEFNAVKVSFEDGVGDASKDEYIVYSDPSTKRMVWLGYTVTYRSNEKSDDFSYIKYENWEEFNELFLPTKLTWYTTDEQGQPQEPRGSKEISNIVPSNNPPMDASFFAKPVGAVVVDR